MDSKQAESCRAREGEVAMSSQVCAMTFSSLLFLSGRIPGPPAVRDTENKDVQSVQTEHEFRPNGGMLAFGEADLGAVRDTEK